MKEAGNEQKEIREKCYSPLMKMASAARLVDQFLISETILKHCEKYYT